MAFHAPIPENKGRPKIESGTKSLIEAEKLMQIAFLLPSAVVVGWLGGAWLGKIFHQSWMMLAGILFGCVAGLVAVIRVALATESASRKLDTSADSTDNFSRKTKDTP